MHLTNMEQLYSHAVEYEASLSIDGGRKSSAWLSVARRAYCALQASIHASGWAFPGPLASRP